jgi:type I restriction enzyme S subunit
MSDVTESGDWVGRNERPLGAVRNGFTAFANGDVLVAKITPCFENGKGAHVTELTNGIGYGSTEFHVLRARDGVSQRFIHHVTQSANLRRTAEAFMSGSAGQRRVPSDFFNRYLVPDISCVEQEALGKILDTLDATIRQTEAIIEKLKQVKQGLLYDLLTRGIDANGELRPPQCQAPHLYKDSPLGWIPNEWRAGQIEDFVARIIDYRGKTPVKTTSGIPLITARNVRMGYVDSEPQEFISEGAYDQWMTRGIPQRGDLLFTMEAPLGNVAQIESDERLAFAQRMIILQTAQNTSNAFLKFLMLGEPFRRRLFSMGSGSTVEGIQQSTFRRLSIAVPLSLTEQREIARILGESDSMIDLELVTLNKLKIAKVGLMDDLLTGLVRVTPLLDTVNAQQ